MSRLIWLPGVITFVCLSALSLSATAVEMTIQFTNDTERALNLKLFSRAESRQEWPSRTKAFSLRPDSAVQRIKITCEEGEQICWGAWMTVQSVSGEIVGASGQRATHTSKYMTGVGDRGQRTCARCCYVCKDGAVMPVATLRDPEPGAK